MTDIKSTNGFLTVPGGAISHVFLVYADKTRGKTPISNIAIRK
jgi:hypothetical protein